MKKNNCVGHFIFLFFFSLCMWSFQGNKNTILWNENRLLTWDDFNGRPEPRFAAASTHYDILKAVTRENDKTALIKIEAVFFTKESWKKKDWINDDVLAHEQKHFDIVELYARKLRKKLKESSFKNYKDVENKLSDLYDANDKEMDAYQDKYDDETDGSMNGDQQRTWQKKIMKEIKELDAYKETMVKVSF